MLDRFTLPESVRRPLTRGQFLTVGLVAVLATETSRAGVPWRLEDYVRHGLAHNHALAAERVSLAVSSAALAEARGNFFPSLELRARYSRAGGGRVIEFPAGDLFNPVYATLNDMLVASGQAPAFPAAIANERVPFLRAEEHDTRLRLVQPLFNLAIYAQLRLETARAEISRRDVRAAEQRLAVHIRVAYFEVAKAEQVRDILAATAELLEENLRVSRSLVSQGRATPDIVHRAEAEKRDLEQRRADAERNLSLARAQLNLLAGRTLDAPVFIVAADLERAPSATPSLERAWAHAIRYREELRAMDAARDANSWVERAAVSRYLPNLNLAADYGFQGEGYRFTAEDDYWMVSAALTWNLFNGLRDRSRHQQAELESVRVAERHADVHQQIRLEVYDAHLGVDVARRAILSGESRVASEEASYRIVEKKFAAGQARQIELFEARTALTSARLAVAIARCDLLQQRAKLRHAIGAQELP